MIKEQQRSLTSFSEKVALHIIEAYKDKMVVVQKDLKGLREKLDDENLKKEHDLKMKGLEDSLEWFKEHALELNKRYEAQ